MKLWFLLIFFISERSEHQTVSSMRRGRLVYHGSRWMLSAWTGIESSRHQSPPSLPTVIFANPTTCLMNFPNVAFRHATSSSVARLVISLTKIAMLIWQLDFDLQYYTVAHVRHLSSVQRPVHLPLYGSNVVSFQCLCLSGLTVEPLAHT